MNFDRDAIEDLMRRVGDENILPHFRNLKEGDVAYKGENDPVTVADKEAEAALIPELMKILPGSRVVGEESVSENPALLDVFRDKVPIWIVDPIDGAKSFRDGNETFAVMIALAVGEEIVAGWIYHPLSREFIRVEKGGGAFYEGERMKLLPDAPLAQMTGLLGGPKIDLMRDRSGPRWGNPFWATCVSVPHLFIDKPFFRCTDGIQWHFRSIQWAEPKNTPWDDAIPSLLLSEGGGYAMDWDGQAFYPARSNLGHIFGNSKETCRKVREWALSRMKQGA
jgi:fructose-1,6-bisphosphatase/inositol monophosphatase family enzyme